MIYLVEIIGTEVWSKKKAWGDISLLFGLTYDSILDILKFEGKIWKTTEKPEWVFYFLEIINETSKWGLDEKSELLLRKFSRGERYNNALKFKTSFDVSRKANILEEKIEKVDVDEERIEEILSWIYIRYFRNQGVFGYDWYTGELKEEHKPLHWDYENQLLNLKENYIESNLERLELENREEGPKGRYKVRELRECIGAIYYDITLQEIKNCIRISSNIKKYNIKTMNIEISPSIVVNINYEQYNHFSEEVGEMVLETMMLQFFEKHKKTLNKSKGITFDRFYDTEDMLEHAHIHRFFYKIHKERLNDKVYYANRIKKQIELLQEYDKLKLYENLVLSMDFVFVWNELVSNRFNLEYYQNKETLNFKEYYLDLKWINQKAMFEINRPVIYLNAVKFTWEQWLHIDLSEKEKLHFFKKNTVLLNEKYNIWQLKLIPARVKLPIKLKMSNKLKNLKRFFKEFPINYYLPTRETNNLLWEYLTFQKFKNYLSSTYKKSPYQIMRTIAAPQNKEEKKMQKKYSRQLQYMKFMYRAYTWFSWDVMLKVIWDYLFYHPYFGKEEDFDPSSWVWMRAKSTSHNDITTAYFIDNYNNILYQLFAPNIYKKWFKSGWKYKIYKYISILNGLWVLYIILYCPGEFLYNQWLLVIPAFTSVYFYFLWYYIKDYVKEDLKGEDLYLYKLQASRRKPILPRGKQWYYMNEEQRENYEKEYGLNGKEVTWRTNNYNYVKNKHNTFRRNTTVFVVLIYCYFVKRFYDTEMWRISKFRGYDYYKKYEEEFTNVDGYRRLIWEYENYERLISGGNATNIWYINYFRQNKNMLPRKLDTQEGLLSNAPVKMKIIKKDLVYSEPRVLYWDFNEADILYMNVDDEFANIYKILLKRKNLGKYWPPEKMKDFYTNVNYLNYKNYIFEQEHSIIRFFTKHSNYTEWSRETKRDAWKVVKYALSKRYRRRRGRKKRIEEVFEYYHTKGKYRNYREFLIDGRHHAEGLIRKEILKLDKKRSSYLAQKDSYKSENPVDIEYLFEITAHEKNLKILYYNLLKLKFYRNAKIHKNDADIKQIILNILHHKNYAKKVIINNKDWEEHFITMHKLNKYIINLSYQSKKWELIIYLFNKKITNGYDLYCNFFKFMKIIWYWMIDLEFIDIIKNIFKLFF